jgi:alanine transaminase
MVFCPLYSSCYTTSLHAAGFVGECGRRGGYMAVTGFPETVTEQILKLASINLCPNISGQICCALMMNPPQEGEPSFELYEKVSLSMIKAYPSELARILFQQDLSQICHKEVMKRCDML